MADIELKIDAAFSGMPDNGAQTIEISSAKGEPPIPRGYHNGKGKAKIADAETEKIIPDNIKKGVSILGVEGALNELASVDRESNESGGETITVNSNGGESDLISLIQDRTISHLPSGLTQIGEGAFSRCFNIDFTSLPEGITKIGQSAFFLCQNLALTSLPEGITEISADAFSGCSKLALASLPEGVVDIQSTAFRGCSELALTFIPKGVTNIGLWAFSGCTSLTSLTFKGTPKSIDSRAFTGCTNLTDIYVPWNDGAVANAPWGATNATIHYNSEV